MKKRTIVWIAMMFLAGVARAGAPATVAKAQIKELHGDLREDKLRLKRVTVELHKELVFILAKEKSDLTMMKASAAGPEAMHQALLDIHENSRKARLALRARGRAERERLRRMIKDGRARIVELRGKK